MELSRLSAVAQARLVREGAVSPTEVVDATASAVERLDPRLGAVVIDLFDRARNQVARLAPTGPLAGVPFLLKDASQEIAGTPHWLGVRALRDAGHVSTTTTPLARRFEELGFVVVGKSSVPELSTGATTEPPGFPPTRNPWDLNRSAGGSSGGAGAAVAAGLVPVAHGADATGSLRFPASCCGVATLKPTFGRLPSTAPAGQPDPGRVWCEFVLARHAGDLAAVFDALTGGPARARAGVTGLRVGLLAEDPIVGAPLHADCIVAVERTGALLEGLGHRVEHSSPGGLTHVFDPIADAIGDVAAWLRAQSVRWVEARVGRPCVRGDLSDEVMTAAERGRTMTGADVATAGVKIAAAFEAIPAWWDDHDLLVTPTVRRPAWRLGQPTGPAQCGLFCAPFSFTGQPALSLPLQWTADDLPVGVQIVAAHGRDELLLDLAQQLQEADDWSRRWPPVSAPSVS